MGCTCTCIGSWRLITAGAEAKGPSGAGGHEAAALQLLHRLLHLHHRLDVGWVQ